MTVIDNSLHAICMYKVKVNVFWIKNLCSEHPSGKPLVDRCYLNMPIKLTFELSLPTPWQNSQYFAPP
jgi:hypothetical protein